MSLFHSVGSSVGRAVDYVLEKNRKTALINRIRIVIKNERENTARAYVALGKYYMEHLRDAENEQTEHLCKAVEESERRMKRAFNKLDEITAPVGAEADECEDCGGSCSTCSYYDEDDSYTDDSARIAPTIEETLEAEASEKEDAFHETVVAPSAEPLLSVYNFDENEEAADDTHA